MFGLEDELKEDAVENLIKLKQAEERIEKLESVLRESLRCLRQGKVQFAPNTTNSDVDVLIEKLTELLEE